MVECVCALVGEEQWTVLVNFAEIEYKPMFMWFLCALQPIDGMVDCSGTLENVALALMIYSYQSS